jgi:hypothetical protein
MDDLVLIIRQTYGWHREMTPFSWYRIARDLHLDCGGVVRTGRSLLEAGILFTENKELGIETNPAYGAFASPFPGTR